MAMAIKKGMEPLDLGPTSIAFADNLAKIRSDKRITYKELSERLSKLNVSIPPLGLRRIEGYARRVNVDDAMALAVALEVSPSKLLLGEEPPTGVSDDVIYSEVIAWYRGETKLDPVSLQTYWARYRNRHEQEVIKALEFIKNYPEGISTSYKDVVQRNVEVGQRNIEIANARISHWQQKTGKDIRVEGAIPQESYLHDSIEDLGDG